MTDHVIEPEALLRQLRERHVHFISEVESRILTAIHQGYTNDEIATCLETHDQAQHPIMASSDA